MNKGGDREQTEVHMDNYCTRTVSFRNECEQTISPEAFDERVPVYLILHFKYVLVIGLVHVQTSVFPNVQYQRQAYCTRMLFEEISRLKFKDDLMKLLHTY